MKNKEGIKKSILKYINIQKEEYSEIEEISGNQKDTVILNLNQIEKVLIMSLSLLMLNALIRPTNRNVKKPYMRKEACSRIIHGQQPTKNKSIKRHHIKQVVTEEERRLSLYCTFCQRGCEQFYNIDFEEIFCPVVDSKTHCYWQQK